MCVVGGYGVQGVVQVVVGMCLGGGWVGMVCGWVWCGGVGV